MRKSTPKEKPTRGRPKQFGKRILLAADDALLSAVDRFIAEQPDPKPSRSAAIRLLLSDHLVGLGILKLPE